MIVCKEEVYTREKYSLLWSKYNNKKPLKKYHFDNMQEVIPDKIVRGAVGLDLGCGCGWDVFIMAKKNPLTRIIGIDISDGIDVACGLNENLANVSLIKGSATQIPLRDKICDFVYSFGVLHHIPNYRKGLLEIGRVLKDNSPCFLYLYENHSDNSIKYIGIKITQLIRKITIRITPKVLYILCFLASPLFVGLFSYPAKFFKRFRFTYGLYEKMPFNFGTGFLSLTGDLYDRLSVPLEHRFDRKGLFNMFKECGFNDINITRLKNTAGWVVWGYKR